MGEAEDVFLEEVLGAVISEIEEVVEVGWRKLVVLDEALEEGGFFDLQWLVGAQFAIEEDGFFGTENWRNFWLCFWQKAQTGEAGGVVVLLVAGDE